MAKLSLPFARSPLFSCLRLRFLGFGMGSEDSGDCCWGYLGLCLFFLVVQAAKQKMLVRPPIFASFADFAHSVVQPAKQTNRRVLFAETLFILASPPAKQKKFVAETLFIVVFASRLTPAAQTLFLATFSLSCSPS